jgi:S1-C subfamily serine protease
MYYNNHLSFISSLLMCVVLMPFILAAQPIEPRQLQSVFKIHATMQRPDYVQPWQASAPANGSGTGFLIAGKRLLTNAHVVSDATFIEVQRHGDSRKFPARVLFAGHDCDLAVLVLEDDSILDESPPMVFGDTLPTLGEEVHAIGFPMGGSMLSLTRGVVSRIDMNGYAHSGVDSHLVIQTDAAINPGNSGGPVVLNNKVVGVAFQGMMGGQNIGYIIPLPVLNHFLDDIADGHYHGYPELGVDTLDSRNPALRRALQAEHETRGAMVNQINPYGAASGRLFSGDILLSVDGHDVAPDATIKLGEVAVNFTELVERKQWGEKMAFEVLRTGKLERVEFPLDNSNDPFAFPNEYDSPPEYIISGGLLFMPISRGLLSTLTNQDPGKVQPIFYYAQRATIDDLAGERQQFVVLRGRLPHAYNSYVEPFLFNIVREVNGIAVNKMSDIRRGLAQPSDGFHLIYFEGSDFPLVLDVSQTGVADKEIMERYGIAALERLSDNKKDKVDKKEQLP